MSPLHKHVHLSGWLDKKPTSELNKPWPEAKRVSRFFETNGCARCAFAAAHSICMSCHVQLVVQTLWLTSRARSPPRRKPPSIFGMWRL